MDLPRLGLKNSMLVHDRVRNSWVVACPAADFLRPAVDERRAGRCTVPGASSWAAIDSLVVVLIAMFYGALGYVLWQLSLFP